MTKEQYEEYCNLRTKFSVLESLMPSSLYDSNYKEKMEKWNEKMDAALKEITDFLATAKVTDESV